MASKEAHRDHVFWKQVERGPALTPKKEVTSIYSASDSKGMSEKAN